MAVFKLNRDGESLRYRVRGRGECVLLLHGLGSSGADWELQVHALERLFTVIVPDLAASDHRTPLEGSCSIAGFAETPIFIGDPRSVSPDPKRPALSLKDGRGDFDGFSFAEPRLCVPRWTGILRPSSKVRVNRSGKRSGL